MSSDRAPSTHLEPVMGTIVGFTSPDGLPPAPLGAAVHLLHEADRVFSTWDPESPISRLRYGRVPLEALDHADASRISEVMARCELAREISGGAFDPWAMTGGFDPTGLVKGWAAGRALKMLTSCGTSNVMVNAGGDIAVSGGSGGRRWSVGIRHPYQPQDFAAVIEVKAAIATSGDYERPGQLTVPSTGQAARGVASATVTGPELDLVDALATGLAVGGRAVLEAIDGLTGYEAFLITDEGHQYATAGMAFVKQPSKI